MSVICTDNRFELVAKYKAKLIESTNIETSADEMAVIDNILFRVWQMGWLDRLEQPTVDAVPVEWIQGFMNRLRNKGQTVCVAAIQGMLEAYGANGEREPANGYGVMAARMLE